MLEGIVDIGSNSVRMTVYDCDEQTRDFQPFFKLKKQLGLASHVDQATGKLDRAGIDSLVDTISEYRRAAGRFVEMRRFACFATAAVRNSSNCQEVLDEVRRRCGVDVELLSGVDEARLGFAGAMWHSGASTGVQIDVGGGSTEVLLFEDGLPKEATSIPLGSLSLFEKHVEGLLPDAREAQRIRDAIAKRLRKAMAPASVACASCIGGSARAMRKVRNAWLCPEDPAGPVTRDELDRIVERIVRKPKAATRELVHVVPERIHTLAPGLLAIQAIAESYQAEKLVVHDSGIREGYLMSRVMGIDPLNSIGEQSRRRPHDVQR